MLSATSHIEDRFVPGLRLLLERRDVAELLRVLEEQWPATTLADLLNADDPDVVKLAAFCLGFRGTMDQNEELARVLHHGDPMAASMAEHALWSVWFRAGSPEANRRLRRIVERMDAAPTPETIQNLSNLIAMSPFFAEAYNQRAIAWYLMGSYDQAIRDCRRTIQLNRFHFGAVAGLGHCYAHLGQYRLALDAYRRALAIHPRLDGVRQAICHLKRLTSHDSCGRGPAG